MQTLCDAFIDDDIIKYVIDIREIFDSLCNAKKTLNTKCINYFTGDMTLCVK